MTKPDGGPAFPCKCTNTGEMETEGFDGEMIAPQTASEYSGMTLREYAAIHLSVPDSGTDWLDEMIRKANRQSYMVHGGETYIAALAGGEKP